MPRKNKKKLAAIQAKNKSPAPSPPKVNKGDKEEKFLPRKRRRIEMKNEDEKEAEKIHEDIEKKLE